jgi:DNA polymerase I-like protein with 3'-5' exonuclease and polymerase domains
MTLEALQSLIANAPHTVIVDTEHLPNAAPGIDTLLGLSLAWPGVASFYVQINHWEQTPSSHMVRQVDDAVIALLSSFLAGKKLGGWNVEHDREWVDAAFGIVSEWVVDGRILWYLTDREQTERGYALKRAQVAILGWPEAGDGELRLEVIRNGGSVDKGDHYLASLRVLAKYAALDASSTLDIITQLSGDANIMAAHDANMAYARFLHATTRRGVPVDEFQLRRAKVHYAEQVRLAEARIREVCAPEIAQIEQAKVKEKLATYTSDKGAAKFLANPSKFPRFNPNSSQQRSHLLHDIIGLPVMEYTKKGAPKSDKKTIAKFDHPAAQSFVELSTNEKLLQFSEQYTTHSKLGLIHFPHDTVSTVSERLGGRVPYDLNMPFSAEPIMRAFSTRPGKVGIHMDFVSIEPCLIAGFSGDPTMLKVYRDGLGDIYLDLCIDLFPLAEANEHDDAVCELIRAFHREYDSNSPPKTEQKEKFGKLRKVAKIIQLAVGYTGTKYTVSKNLTQAGFPCDLERGEEMITRYWARFSRVATLANKLRSIATERGFINGLYNRRLYIPKKLTKDSLNRFAQHGGHAILRDTVMEIERNKLPGMDAVLPDIHDSTSWEINEADYDKGVEIFKAAIRRVNSTLSLPVQVAGEIKLFRTFFGLKNREE